MFHGKRKDPVASILDRELDKGKCGRNHLPQGRGPSPKIIYIQE
ncbi:rCG62910 [Rattus norvegicus]|uniref:RCG62910 n=1 Tax=Rattus norvegicus TaxID=10116 RepID=A6J3K8_RAT|nr:rCG62910 [Rattus norvegicus]